MKKECYRKSPDCAGCVFHRPEGKRQGAVIDPDAVWKEACGCTGYSFYPELEPDEICFDRLSEEQWIKIQKTSDSRGSEDLSPRALLWVKTTAENSKKWARGHICTTCAFYGLNGYDILDKVQKKKLSWFTTLRCRGYVFDPSREARCGVCCDYISLDQWATIVRTPITDGRRIAAWDGFKRENLEKQNSNR